MHNSFKQLLQSTLFFALFTFISFSLNAQNASNYKLLWKIESQNSKKASYLFGTMHIEDKRAFNFSDAVFPAMQNSDKFALEVQADSIAQQFSEQKFETKAYLVFKELLSDEEFKQLDNRFFEINGFTLEESNVDDPDALLMMFEPEDKKDDDNANFVDLHLLAHAKTMQKEIIGLENINNQLNIFINLSEEEKRETLLETIAYDIETYKDALEEMINIYITGDINAIDNYLVTNDGYDALLIKRNQEMSQSIIREIENNTSVFSAVGAAHLPGEFGIINLLQEKGYTLTPVEANFTGVAKNYQIDDSKMLWKTYTNTNFGYSVQTPSNVTEDTSSPNLIMNSSIDLFSNKYYSFFAIDLRATPKKVDKETLFAQIIENAQEKYDATNIIKKSTTHAGAAGYDVTYELQEDDDYSALRSVYLIKNDIFYQFFILGNLEKVNSKAADRFFNSIRFSDPKPLPIVSEDWIHYHNKKGAFSVQLPKEPNDVSRKVDSGIEGVTEKTLLNMYASQNASAEDNYIVRYNDLPIGYRVEDLEASFKAIENSFLATSKLLSEPKVIYKDGYEGRQYELLIKNVSHGICKLYFRGNRTYLLLSHKLVADKKTDPNHLFFESFKFEDFEEEAMEEQNTIDFTFNTLPENIQKIDADDYSDSYLEKFNEYYSKNNQSGDMYSFGYSKLKPYFKIDTLQKFYNINKESLTAYNEIVTNEKKVLINDVEGYEFITISETDSIHSKHVLWLDNNYFFVASAYTSKENINSRFTNNILYSYKSKNKNKTIDYYASKAATILQDLKSNDSLVFQNAIGAFEYYEFEKTDLKKLYQAAQSEYASTKNKDVVLSKIITELGLVNAEDTLDFLEDLYNDTSINDTVKREILILIPDLENNNGLEVYKKLFINNPPKIKADNNYDLFTPFRDSTQFAITNYKDFIGLKNTSNYKSQVLSISTNILQSDNTRKEEILSYFNTLTDSALIDLNSYVKMLSDENYDFSSHNLMLNYLDYLENIPNSTKSDFIDNFTTKLIKSKANRWIIWKASQARIKHNLPISKSTKSALLDSLDTRFSTIKMYHQVNKLHEVPSKYLSLKAFSELSLQQYLYDVEEYPNQIELLGELKIQEKMYHAYSLKYSYEESVEDEFYLVITASSFKITQQEEFKAYPIITNWDFLEENWKKQSEDLILKSLESE